MQATPGSYEISIYQSGRLSRDTLSKETAKILQAFPKMPMPTFNLLKDRFVENKFTDERLRDSVNYVIDNYQGFDKTPNIADFIIYDKKVKFFNFEETQKIGQENLAMVDLGFSTPRWVYREDAERYKLKLWVKVDDGPAMENVEQEFEQIDLRKKYLDFVKNNKELFSDEEIAELKDLFKQNAIFRISFIVEPKIEACK